LQRYTQQLTNGSNLLLISNMPIKVQLRLLVTLFDHRKPLGSMATSCTQCWLRHLMPHG